MSETTEQSIGDNSLIKTLLATRIAETPTKKVDEVEIPEPEIIEAEHIEILKKTEAPEPQPVDYTEYDEEPAKIQKDIPLSAEKPNLPAEISEDKKAKQRKISSRWGVRLYDKFQALGAMVVYDKLNGPNDYVNRRDELMEKVYDGKISEKEREELKEVNGIVDGFMSRRTTYHESVHMSSELVEDISEMLEELLEQTDTNINPIWILAILLLIQPVMNLVTSMTHKMQFNTRY